MKLTKMGFTLVEVMVALLVFTLGVLGAVKATGGLARMVSEGKQEAGAAAIAQDRMERLRATSCASMAGGSETVRKYSVSWAVTSPVSSDSRAVTVVAAYENSNGARADTFQTLVLC